jgi:molecular chaperone GrpE (heat shock protein)
MLQQTERFQTDVRRYRENIDKLINDQDKFEATRLLNDLIFAVKNMDNMYVEMVYAKQLPTQGNEMRDKIVSIRKQLDNKIKNI